MIFSEVAIIRPQSPMRLQLGSDIESMRGDIEPGFVVGSDKEGRMQRPGELRRKNEALGDRISRISVSLDVRTVLEEEFERVWSLSLVGLCSQRCDVLVPCWEFGA